MAKIKLLKEVYWGIESSNDEFHFDSLNSDIEIVTVFLSIYTSDFDNDIITMKREVMQLEIFNYGEVDEHYENENSRINDFTSWKERLS